MLGHILDWCNTVMLVFLGVGAIAGVVVVVSATIVVKMQRQA